MSFNVELIIIIYTKLRVGLQVETEWIHEFDFDFSFDTRKRWRHLSFWP